MENYTSDSSENEDKIIDYAYFLLDIETVDKNLEEFTADPKKSFLEIEHIILHHNILSRVPDNVHKFSNVRTLDISNNGLEVLPDIFKNCPLTTLVAKNNLLTNDSLPKSFSNCTSLRELNLSGNRFHTFPEQILEFINLKYLYMGGNQMVNISRNIYKLINLQILSFGGNHLLEVPSTLAQLKQLQSLVLCDNKLESLPSSIANLHSLKSLLLHKNKLRTLPPDIIALKNLTELSLRENPLVVRFVSDMVHHPPTLLELSARTIKHYGIPVTEEDVPRTLWHYMDSAHHCVNPHCKGVYFDNRVEHIKFVDFCGKYRIPLLQYLCSSKCATNRNEDFVRPSSSYLMKKVLLG